MPILNVEFKARTSDLEKAEKQLLSLNPAFIGEDQQTDTYFHVQYGRLKLREGTIENALIHYQRLNTADAKRSDVLLHHHDPGNNLKEILTRSLGIKAIVNKKRKIYFIENVKFHFDTIADLGTFIEVEAIDTSGELGILLLKQQCNEYAAFFNISTEDYIGQSYSDLMAENRPY